MLYRWCFWGLKKSAERLDEMYFTEEPLSNEKWVLWIRKSDIDRLRYTSFEDLRSNSVGVVKGYNYPEDFTVSLLGIGHEIIKNQRFETEIIPITTNPLFSSSFYVVFNKNNISKEWVDQFSDELVSF